MNVQRIPISRGAGRLSGETAKNDVATRAPAPKAATARTAAPTLQEVRTAVGDINNAMRSLASQLEFCIDEKTRGIMVKVVDTRTNQIIREFSTGKVLGIAKAVGEVVQGLLLQESA